MIRVVCATVAAVVFLAGLWFAAMVLLDRQQTEARAAQRAAEQARNAAYVARMTKQCAGGEKSLDCDIFELDMKLGTRG